MTATSLKQLYQAGDIKKKDIFRMPYSLLRVQHGFNPRDINKPETQAKIQGMKESIKDGAFIPPLLVRIVDGFGVITDGECRFTAYGLAIAEGCEIEMIDVQPDNGNDADRTATTVTTSQGEALTPLETAVAYKRLTAYGWEPAKIAARVGKTVQHVAGLLVLGNAPSEVQGMVRDGTVSAATAVEVVRKHGENSGEVLRGEVDKAKAQGKRKVTAGTIKGKALPRVVVDHTVDALDALVEALAPHERESLAYIEQNAMGGPIDQECTATVPAWALLELMKAHAEVTEAKNAEAQRVRDAQAKAAQVEIPANDNQADAEAAA